MPVPTGYDEATLAAYMHAVLGRVAAILGWTAPASYVEVVNDVTLACGAAVIEDVTDIRKVRALARREVWRAAVNGLVASYNLTADGATFNRSQITAQARSALQIAITDALPYDDSYVVGIDRMTQEVDPYIYSPVDA